MCVFVCEFVFVFIYVRARSVAQSCPLRVTPWTAAGQAPLSVGFSGQESWGRLPFPPSGDLPNPGLKPESPAFLGRFFTT